VKSLLEVQRKLFFNIKENNHSNFRGKLRRRPSATRNRYNNFPSPYNQQQATNRPVNSMVGPTLCQIPPNFSDYSVPNPNFFGRLPINFLNMLQNQQQISTHNEMLQQHQKLSNTAPGLITPISAAHLFMPGPSNSPNTPPTSTSFGPETFLNLQSIAAAHQQATNPFFFLQDLQKMASILNGSFAKKN
jgi:hypothetical protein